MEALVSGTNNGVFHWGQKLSIKRKIEGLRSSYKLLIGKGDWETRERGFESGLSGGSRGNIVQVGEKEALEACLEVRGGKLFNLWIGLLGQLLREILQRLLTIYSEFCGKFGTLKVL